LSTEIKVPDIGDFKDVEIIEILVKEGQSISKNEPLITLESDKSSVEVPSPLEGTIEKLNVKVGDRVSQGSIIGSLSANGVAENTDKAENVSEPKTEEKVVENKSDDNFKTNGSSPIIQNPRVEIKQQNFYGSNPDLGDIDPEETHEWIESLNSVVKRDGAERAHYLLTKLINQAYVAGSNLPFTQNTPYINTIPPELEVRSPGDQAIEKRIRALIRWNAAAMVVKANKVSPELGGHIATFASAAT